MLLLYLVERVIWNRPPPSPPAPPRPPQRDRTTTAGSRGAAPVGSRGKAPVGEESRGTSEAVFLCSKGVWGKSSGLPPAIIPDAVGVIIPDAVGIIRAGAAGAIKPTTNQTNISTSNIHTNILP